MPRLVNKNVKMEVPENMLAEMQAYMERLKLSSTIEPVEETMTDVVQCEVSGVFDHKVENGIWQFQVAWKGLRKKEWVNDEDCNCDSAIAKYLKDKNIHTAYLFCRVSTPDQATSVNVSLEAQASELRTAAINFERIKVYSISQSAFRNIPKTLRSIGESALSGDGIFVWRVDRLSRNIIKYLAWIEELNDRGVILYSHQENLIYSEKKLDFLQAVLNAQREAVILGERVKLSYKHKRERGDERVGGLPYGKKYHRLLREDGMTMRKTVVDHPDEMAVVDRIVKNKCESAAKLAEQLNREGITKRGRKWNRLSVIRLHRKMNKV